MDTVWTSPNFESDLFKVAITSASRAQTLTIFDRTPFDVSIKSTLMVRLLPLFDSVPFYMIIFKFVLPKVMIMSSLKVWTSPPLDIDMYKVRSASASRAQNLSTFNCPPFNIMSFKAIDDIRQIIGKWTSKEFTGTRKWKEGYVRLKYEWNNQKKKIKDF